MQRRFVSRHAGIAANQMQLAHRNIESGVVGIFQMQKLLHGVRSVGVLLPHIQIHQTAIAANAVLGVHDRIAHFQLREVFDQRFHIAGLLLPFAATHGALRSKQLGLGDEINAAFIPGKALKQRRNRHARLLATGLEFLQTVKHGQHNMAGAQEIHQALAAAFTLRRDQNAMRTLLDMRFELNQRFVAVALRGQIRQARCYEFSSIRRSILKR